MLVVIEKEHRVHETVEVDEYVSFTAEFGKGESSPLYWRGGDGRLSLVEIGLTKIGDICSITLTSISQESVVQVDDPLPTDTLEISGLPVFDITNWSSNASEYASHFQDDFDSELKLIVGCDYLSLIFVKVAKPVRYIKNERVRFGVASSGELSTIDLVELTQDQIKVIKSAI